MPEGNTTPVTQNSDGSYTLYDQGGLTVTLTFPPTNNPSQANFTVVKKTIDNSGLPAGYNWVVDFGIKNPAGHYLPSVTYHLQGSDNKNWVIYYGNDPDRSKNIHPMNGTHENAPGDPPIGYGQT